MEIIDVSKWQGKINWPLLKKTNPAIKGTYIKASEGIGYTDPFLKINAAGAKKEGFEIGYYHFASLNTDKVVNDAIMEAKAFLKIIDGLPINLPLVLDIESNAAKISNEKVLSWIMNFFQEIQRHGIYDFALYSYCPFLNANLPVSHKLGGVKLWLAAYTTNPKIPTGWAGYWLWQYSSKGKLKGISGNVDLNKFQ